MNDDATPTGNGAVNDPLVDFAAIPLKD